MASQIPTTYVGMGTVSSPNHHLEVKGSNYFEHREAGKLLTEVPVEIFSSYADTDEVSYEGSRQLRYRVKVKDADNAATAPTGNAYAVVDSGIDWEGGFWFLTAPSPYIVGNKESFTLNYEGRVGISTSSPRAQLDVRSDLPLAWGANGRQWALLSNKTLLTENDGTVRAGLVLASVDAAEVEPDFTGVLPTRYLTIRDSGEVGIGATATFPQVALQVEGPDGIKVNSHLLRCGAADFSTEPSQAFGTLTFGIQMLPYAEAVTHVNGTWRVEGPLGDRVRIEQDSVQLMATAAGAWSADFGQADFLANLNMDNTRLQVLGPGSRSLEFQNWTETCLAVTDALKVGDCALPRHIFGVSTPSVQLFANYAGAWTAKLGTLTRALTLTPTSVSNASSELVVGNVANFSIRLADDLRVRSAGVDSLVYATDSALLFSGALDWTAALGDATFCTLARADDDLVVKVRKLGDSAELANTTVDSKLTVQGVSRLTRKTIVGGFLDTGLPATLTVRSVDAALPTLLVKNDQGDAEPFSVTYQRRVGVATGAPSAMLHVESHADAGTDVLLRLADESYVGVGQQAHGTALEDGTFFLVSNSAARANVAEFRTSAGATCLALADDGKIGLGTAAPAAQLHVVAPAGTDPFLVDGALILTDAGALGVGTVAPRAYVDLVAPDAALDRLWMDGDGAGATFRVDSDGRLGLGALALGARAHIVADGEAALLAEDSTGTPHLRVESLRAGVGTAPDLAALDVLSHDTSLASLSVRDSSGTVRLVVQEGGAASLGYDLTAAASLARFHVEAPPTWTLPTWLLTRAGGTQAVVTKEGRLGLGVGTAPTAFLHAQSPLATIPTAVFTGAAGTESFCVDSVGRLGVGTTTPQAKLHVTTASGDVRAFVQANGAARSYLQLKGANVGANVLSQAILLDDGTSAARIAQEGDVLWLDSLTSGALTWTRSVAGSVGVKEGALGLGSAPDDDATLRLVTPTASGRTYAIALGADSGVTPPFSVTPAGDVVAASLSTGSLAADSLALDIGPGVVSSVNGRSLLSYAAAEVALNHPDTASTAGLALSADGHASLGAAPLPGDAKFLVVNDQAASLTLRVDDAFGVSPAGQVGVGTLAPEAPVHVFGEVRQDILGVDTLTAHEDVLVSQDNVRVQWENQQVTAPVQFAEYARGGITFGNQDAFVIGGAAVSSAGDFSAPRAEFGGAPTAASANPTVLEANRNGDTVLAVEAPADPLLPASVLVGHLGPGEDRLHLVSGSEDQPGIRVENLTQTPSSLTLAKASVGDAALSLDNVGVLRMANYNGVAEMRTVDGKPSVHVGRLGQVGVNTDNPKDALHVYDGDLRITALRSNVQAEFGFDYTVLTDSYTIRNHTIQGGTPVGGAFANEYLDLTLGNGARVFMGRTHHNYYMTAAGAMKKGTAAGLQDAPSWQGAYLGTKLTFLLRAGTDDVLDGSGNVIQNGLPPGWNMVQGADADELEEAGVVDTQNAGVDVLVSSAVVNNQPVTVFDLAAVFGNTFYSPAQDYPGGMVKDATEIALTADDLAYEYTGGNYTLTVNADGLEGGDVVLGYKSAPTVATEYNFVSSTGMAFFRLSETPGGTLSGGIEFLTGVTVSGDTLVLQVDASTPAQLYLYDPANVMTGSVSVRVELDETLEERHTWVRRTVTDGFTLEADGVTVTDNVTGVYFFKLAGRVDVDWAAGEYANETNFHVVTSVYPLPDGVTTQKQLTAGDESRAAIKFMSGATVDGLEDYGALYFNAMSNGDAQEAQFALCVGGGSSSQTERFKGLETICEEIQSVDQQTGNLSATGTYGVTRSFFRNGNVGIGTDDPQFPLHVESYGWLGAQRLAYWVHEDTTKLFDPLNPGISADLGTQSNFIGIHSRYSISTSMALIALSDRRVKHDVRDLDDGESLRIIEALQPKKFKRRDFPGEKIYYGFIAQEVANVLPDAVYVNQRPDECVHDVRAYVDVLPLSKTEWRVTLPREPDNGEMREGERLHFVIGDDAVERYATVKSVVERNVLVIALDKSLSIAEKVTKVYCTGRCVSDLKQLHEAYIFSVGISATQELLRKNQQLEQRVKDLEIAVRELLNARNA